MLTNSQYDKLYREYEEQQLLNKQIMDSRLREVATSIPQYSELTDELSQVTSSLAEFIRNNPGEGLSDYKKRIKDISFKKASLLQEHGFPSDYLDPVFKCYDCKDTGFIGTSKCHCFKQKIISFAYNQSHIKSFIENNDFSKLSYQYYRDEDLTAFKIAVEISRSFIRNFDSGYDNLLFYGNVGVGKTFLSGCIAKELLDAGKIVLYLSSERLADVFSKKIYNKNSSTSDELPEVDDLFDCDLLIIDDLGTELTNNFVTSNLFSLLNERHIREKSVIISTNLSLNEIGDVYSERIASRLFSNYVLCKISGPDIRVVKKKVQELESNVTVRG